MGLSIKYAKWTTYFPAHFTNVPTFESTKWSSIQATHIQTLYTHFTTIQSSLGTAFQTTNYLAFRATLGTAQ